MYNIMKVEINNYVPIPLFTTSLQFDSNAPEFQPRSKSFPLFVTTTFLNRLVASATVTHAVTQWHAVTHAMLGF